MNPSSPYSANATHPLRPPPHPTVCHHLLLWTVCRIEVLNVATVVLPPTTIHLDETVKHLKSVLDIVPLPVLNSVSVNLDASVMHVKCVSTGNLTIILRDMSNTGCLPFHLTHLYRQACCKVPLIIIWKTQPNNIALNNPHQTIANAVQDGSSTATMSFTAFMSAVSGSTSLHQQSAFVDDGELHSALDIAELCSLSIMSHIQRSQRAPEPTPITSFERGWYGQCTHVPTRRRIIVSVNINALSDCDCSISIRHFFINGSR